MGAVWFSGALCSLGWVMDMPGFGWMSTIWHAGPLRSLRACQNRRAQRVHIEDGTESARGRRIA